MDEMNEKKIEEVIEETTPRAEETEVSNAPAELPEAGESASVPEVVEDAAAEGEGTGDEASESDKQEEVAEGEKKEEETDTTTSDDSSVATEEEKTEETLEEPEVTPGESVEELKQKIEALEYEKAIDTSVREYDDLLAKNKRDFEDFQSALAERIKQECVKYGVPLDMDIERMRVEAPDKYNILCNICNVADQQTNAVRTEIENQERQAAQDIVFTKAGVEMAAFKLTQEQAKAASQTFVKIVNETGIRDLGEDLKAKVELAVAHAKMLVPDIQKVAEDVHETIKDAKTVVEKAVEAVQEVKEVTKDTVEDKLKEYKEGAAAGEISAGPEVTKDNVMEIYLSKKGKDRLAFFAKHKDLIMNSGKPMPYTDNRRYY